MKDRSKEDEVADININTVNKYYGDVHVIKDVSLDIKSQSFTVLVGPSGCGKTTLLRCIAGLEIQSTGSVFQKNKDISNLPPSNRDFGIVFQSYALFPNLSVFSNVSYGLINNKWKKADIKKRVDELLSLVNLTEHASKYPSQLSGGEQQRVALARALATSPGLLLLDEPLSALDAKVRVFLRKQIRDLQRKLGVTTIMVTHDQEEAMTLSDRIAIMEEGQFVQIGSPNLIYENPKSKFVADFLGNINLLKATITEQNDSQIVINCAALGGELKFNQAEQSNALEMTVALRPEKWVIEKCKPTNESRSHVKGIVEDFGYFGNLSIYRVRTESGHIIQVSKQIRDRV